jgi:hypothetical protein
MPAAEPAIRRTSGVDPARGDPRLGFDDRLGGEKMDVISVGPLRAGSVVWKTKTGAWTFTVVAKATYRLAPVESPLAEEQEEPLDQDLHWDDDATKSLRCATDLAPMKPRPEVTLVGHAFAPAGKPVRSLIARMVVGEVDKAIEVHADRYLTMDGVLHESQGFTCMPLVWERARGGPESWNPVGVAQGVRNGLGRSVLPNLTVHNEGVDTIGEPMCFGPLGPSWPARRSKLARMAPPMPRTLPITPLPPGFDFGFFNVAPFDQVLTSLRDNERIVLENLHPDHPRLVTNLCGARPRVFVDWRTAGPQPIAMRADTLAIDTDKCSCTLTWRGHFPLARPDERGRVLVATELGGAKMGFAEVADLADALRDEPTLTNRPRWTGKPEPQTGEEVGSTTMAEEDARKLIDALPFAQRGSQPPIPPPRRSENSLHGLPFQPSGSAPHPPLPRAPKPVHSGTIPMLDALSSRTEEGRTAPHPIAFQSPDDPARPAMAIGGAIGASGGIGNGSLMLAGAAALPFTPAAPAPVVAPAPVITRQAEADSPWASGMAGREEQARPTVGTLAIEAAAPIQPLLSKANQDNSVFHTSNLAAQVLPEVERPVVQIAEPPPPPPPAEKPAEKAAAPSFVEVVDLVWFDKAALPRIRKKAAWRALVQALEDRPPDPDLDDASLGTPAEVEDRRDVFEVLTKGLVLDSAGIEDALAQAIRTDGKVVPPLVLAGGELTFPFDDVETLRSHVAVIAPLATGDDKLKAELALVKDFLATPDLACARPMVEALSARLWEAFARAKRAVSAETLKAHTESVLLQKRRYQRCEVFGGNQLRALLYAGDKGGNSTAQPPSPPTAMTPAANQQGPQPFPAYLPASLSSALPMYSRFRTRVIVEVHLAVDQHETAQSALRILALARLVERARRAPAPIPGTPVSAAGAPPVPPPRDSKPY